MRSLKTLFSLIPSFASSGKRSLSFLNITQSLGVVNDNIFKFSMAFLLISVLGDKAASSVLSATGAIYVIPFLLVSSSAGILADRFSKQKLLVLMKVAEVILMLLAVLAFAAKNVWGCYLLLFFISIHSALFSPSKYGIIPELVPKEAVSKANGLVTACTYLSVIIGTFLASFLTEITDHAFVHIALFCLLIAVGGLLSALAIKPTPAQGSQKQLNFLFIQEIYRSLKYARTIYHLLPAVLGTSFFLLIGSFTQLNIIPFAISSLGLNEVSGGYLFLVTALGIALGSHHAGKISKKKIELGMCCMAGFGIALCFCFIALFSFSLIAVVVLLFILGILGGIFIVPFDTFTQINSPHERRGQTIAAANFLSFFGVLVASFLLYFLNQLLGLSPATSFAVVGALSALVAVLFTLYLADLFIPYFSRRFFCPCTRIVLPPNDPFDALKKPILVLEQANWTRALQLAAGAPTLHFLIYEKSALYSPLLRLITSVIIVPHTEPLKLLQIAQYYTEQGLNICVLLDNSLGSKAKNTSLFASLFGGRSDQIMTAQFDYNPQSRHHHLLFNPW